MTERARVYSTTQEVYDRRLPLRVMPNQVGESIIYTLMMQVYRGSFPAATIPVQVDTIASRAPDGLPSDTATLQLSLLDLDDLQPYETITGAMAMGILRLEGLRLSRSRQKNIVYKGYLLSYVDGMNDSLFASLSVEEMIKARSLFESEHELADQADA